MYFKFFKKKYILNKMKYLLIKKTLMTWISIIFFMTSCSILTSKEKSADSENDFKQVVSRRTNKETTPVEVATEFNELLVDDTVVLPTLYNDSQLKSPIRSSAGRPPADEKSEALQKTEDNAAIASNGRNKNKRTYIPIRTVASQKSIKEKYIVRPGDTLMKISFENFGDIYQWKNILNDNKNQLKNGPQLVPGMELVINGTSYIVVEKNGTPYLIKKNDTLIKISKNIYGSGKHWSRLWKNNPQLIRDPDKIYAGFTLYYQDLNLAKNQPLEPKTKFRLPASNAR